MSDGRPLNVYCPECGFSQQVLPCEERVAADVVIEHGRKTGHKLRVTDAAADGAADD
ncbi:MAG: hypothetical protein ABEJ31_10270 [Haloarculaceae archaeon]